MGYGYIIGLFVGYGLGIIAGISLGVYLTNKKTLKELEKGSNNTYYGSYT